MKDQIVYNLNEIYGTFFECGTLLTLDQEQVPRPLWPLIPYAAFWGIVDDWERESLVRKAPLDVRENLKAIVAANDDLLDEWLAGSESSSPNPSQEYVAFSAMRMAADFM
jgi:hypothetical protein